jgi:hypothetical protein
MDDIAGRGAVNKGRRQSMHWGHERTGEVDDHQISPPGGLDGAEVVRPV